MLNCHVMTDRKYLKATLVDDTHLKADDPNVAFRDSTLRLVIPVASENSIRVTAYS